MADIKLLTMSYKDIGEKGARYALDEIEYNGLTIRQWADKITSGEYAPVVHGSLKHTGTLWSSMWICTNCNEIAYYPPHGNRKKRIIQPCGYKYCPNCGAKMDEEVN